MLSIDKPTDIPSTASKFHLALKPNVQKESTSPEVPEKPSAKYESWYLKDIPYDVPSPAYCIEPPILNLGVFMLTTCSTPSKSTESELSLNNDIFIPKVHSADGK